MNHIRIKPKTANCMLTACILLFAATGITGCVKEYTADDIRAYAEDTLFLK